MLNTATMKRSLVHVGRAKDVLRRRAGTPGMVLVLIVEIGNVLRNSMCSVLVYSLCVFLSHSHTETLLRLASCDVSTLLITSFYISSNVC